MRLLIYTDSRGQHTPRGEPVHDVFATRLAKRQDVEATVLLCPMKWTTTIDFLDVLSSHNPGDFDHTILFTGIVDWSPRPLTSAVNDLYNNPAPLNLNNLGLNTREYARKVVNSKKPSFDRIFTEPEMRDHFSRDLGVPYEGQPTANMYSLEMAERYLLPHLKAIDNLIFINSNRFVPGWEGDYTRGRPANIGLTEQYSALFRDVLGPDKVVDLLQWDEAAVRVLTCDNLHLSKAGSDWIYEALCDRVGGGARPSANRSSNGGASMKVETFSLPPPPHSGQKNDSILIIGNGPSARQLAEFGLDQIPDTIDTFGMGAAYRHFEEIDWWPTYYAWCDVKVVHSHRDALTKLIDNPRVSTREFFFSLPISSNPKFTEVSHGSTGDFCFRKAVELGYKNIYLIGIEGDYVEELAEARPLTDKEYYTLNFDELFPLFEHLSPDPKVAMSLYRDNLRIIQQTPAHNPNYFFEGYQRAGDVYSLPRAQTHRNSWRNTVLAASQANVINLSAESKIDYFRKAPWETFAAFALDSGAHREMFAPNGRPIETPVRLWADDRAQALSQAGLGPNDKLATLVIGVRLPEKDDFRVTNLRVLLDWIDCYYGDLFDVLLLEQDAVSHIDRISDRMRPYVRHEFVYNPDAFNRGWGYNVAVKHFTDAKVVGLLDTDVLTGANFVQEIIDCHRRFKAISPYTSVYYTDPEEAARVSLTFDLDHLRNEARITKPTTICGGIVIVRRATYLAVAGFEQYIEFAGEDRSLDVTLLNYCAPEELRSAPYTYAHLNHPYNNEARPRAKELFAHLHSQFGCKHDPTLGVMDDIHKNCRHVPKEKTVENSDKRRAAFGDVNLYRSERTLAVNGVYADAQKTSSGAETPAPAPAARGEPVFPPAFKSLETYAARELYEAPEPDAAKLAKLFNAYKGKRCFIIGNGPSLNKHDLSLLKDEYSFAVNSFYYKTAETGFRPTFFVVEDDAVMRENIEHIRAYEAPYKFFPTNYKSLHPGGSNVFFFRMNRGFYEKSSPNYCVPRFSTDASKVLYCGQSVTYINLQLAFFMGFTEVYLIGMDFDYVIPAEHERKGDFIYSTTDDPNHFHKDYFGKGKTWKDPKLERVASNYRQAKLSFEAVGRHVYNATIGGKLDIFDRVDFNHLLKDGVKMRPASATGVAAPANADASLLEMPRDSHATVIETKVVSKLLEQRRGPDRVMLDVGAHVGLTASYFHELGWTVHCFEPDPKNRAKLEERYRDILNVTIDTRAVSDKPARNVAFFTSEESTGISGLHAFHNTHKQTGAVDVTTLRDVATDRKLKRVDFLKIDVEGFDFSVLKGVPWETIKPDVIECEFEDAKTVRLGHTWRDVAEFLRGKGYTVYVSEWHPIVRYGIRHDWRRVWRYPEFDMEPTAWGNFVAFREDPGYAAVRAVFAETMKLYPGKPGAKPTVNPPPASATPAQSAASRPQLHIQQQQPHQAARDEFPTTPARERRAFYADFGEGLRSRSPAAFGALRFFRRAVAGVWRRRAVTIPTLLVLAALPLLALAPSLAAYRPYLLGATAFLVGMAAIGYVAMRFYVAIGHQIAELQETTRRMDELREETGRIGASLHYARERLQALKVEDQKLRRDLDKRVGLIRAEVDIIRSRMMSDFSSLQDEISTVGERSAPSLTLAEVQALLSEADHHNSALRDEIEISLGAIKRDAEFQAQRVEALKAQVVEQTEARAQLMRNLEELRAEAAKRQAAAEAQSAALRTELAGPLEALKADAAKRQVTAEAQGAALRTEIETLRAEVTKREAALQQQVNATSDTMQKAFAVDRANVARLRDRLASSERQLGAVKFPDTPSTLVFFGHHKCASRFFRNEVFTMAAEVLGARTRKYEIKFPPFHYSMSDELDLVNTDLEGLGKDGRDVVLFSNATMRTLQRIQRKAGEDWRGLRVIRDPRQVLVSDYLHHKDGHHTEWNGWVWDQLVRDKPILNEVPQEEGLLHELDNISKQIIETQVLAPFNDPRIMTIKIEDFAKDPKTHLQKISGFLRVSDISGIDFSRTAANPESGPWQKFFSSKLRQVFKERYGQALIDLGYAEDFDW